MTHLRIPKFESFVVVLLIITEKATQIFCSGNTVKMLDLKNKKCPICSLITAWSLH